MASTHVFPLCSVKSGAIVKRFGGVAPESVLKAVRSGSTWPIDRSVVMARALKVFRTPIGFHDAYVAAPTQKAALEAWGTDRNLFARGDAEIVTDPKLTKIPLSRPGEVIRVSRGSAAEQIAALPKTRRQAKAAPATSAEPTALKAKRSRPKPSRAKLLAAEQAVTEADAAHEADRTALDREIEALEAKRRRLEQAQAREKERLRERLDRARDAYSAAMDRWEG